MAYTTIDDPSVYFQNDIYTAGSGTDTVTFDGNSNLQPDLIWVKSMDTAYNHQFHDSSRGATTGAMYTNLGNAEDSTYHVDNFLTDGYINDSVNTAIHANTEEIVSYGWKANGGTTSSVSASGSGASRVAASTYQANTTSKFSICTWTGTDDTSAATITHGLGVAPEFIIIKCRNEASTDWTVYHHKNTTAPQTDILVLNTNAATSDNDRFNDTAPTSTVFSVNASSSTVNANGDTYVAYCWAGVQGYSKCGRYEGNGNANGTYVVTGFKPAWVMIKNTESTESWVLYDNARNPSNVVNRKIAVDQEDTDNTATGVGGAGYNDIDIYSNGFKHRTNSSAGNENDADYIYVAFAAEPFVTSGGVPATAV